MTSTHSRPRLRPGALVTSATAGLLVLSGCSALPGFSESEQSSETPASTASTAPAQDCAAIVPILGKLPALQLDGTAADYFTEYANSVTMALNASTNGEISATLTGINEQITRASDVTTRLAALGDTSGLNPAQLIERAQQAADLAAEAKTVFSDLTTQVGKLTALCPQVK
ncbi:hypothetical protein [Mycetocola sp. JXN-3]|uniref:hypothetical protein n=1 Tax=Mycetocola sp. JXN-3 TaxID=2116510 RepID=UPI00165D0790|nr:hypothetical protein [Mycetocola sp. JXN-3]